MKIVADSDNVDRSAAASIELNMGGGGMFMSVMSIYYKYSNQQKGMNLA
jgi:hypothetical protein